MINVANRWQSEIRVPADGDGPKVRRTQRGTAPRVRTWPADSRMRRYFV